MGNRFARACISSRLTKPANTKAGNSYEESRNLDNNGRSAQVVAHAILDAIIVEFCTQLRLRRRIPVWLAPRPSFHPRPPEDYAGGFSTLDGTIHRGDGGNGKKGGGKNNAARRRDCTSRIRVHSFEDQDESSSINITGPSKRNVSRLIVCQSPDDVVIRALVKRSVGFLRSLLVEDTSPASLSSFPSSRPFDPPPRPPPASRRDIRKRQVKLTRILKRTFPTSRTS